MLSDASFRFPAGGPARAPWRNHTQLIAFSHVEYGQLEGSEQPAAFVFVTAHLESPVPGNAMDPYTVFVFRMSEQCQLESLGAFEPASSETRIEDRAFVVIKRPGRDEWRVRGKSMQRTLSTNKDVLATSAPPWRPRDLAQLARVGFRPMIEQDPDLLALFQATLGESYHDFYWGMNQSRLSYARGWLSGSGCERVNCLKRSFFTLSDQGDLFAAVLDGREFERFGPRGKKAPAEFERDVQEAHAELKSIVE